MVRLDGYTSYGKRQRGCQESGNPSPRLLRGIPFDQIYSSDLCRAVETAKIALPDGNCKTDPRLREIHLGSWSGQSHSAVSKETVSLARKIGYKEFGGESMKEFSARIKSIMSELENTNFSNVALFSHGGLIRAMLDLVLETKLDRNHILCNNCTVAIFHYSNKFWRLHSWINLN